MLALQKQQCFHCKSYSFSPAKATVFPLQKLQCFPCKSYSVSPAKATGFPLQKLQCWHCKSYNVSTAKATGIAMYIYIKLYPVSKINFPNSPSETGKNVASISRIAVLGYTWKQMFYPCNNNFSVTKRIIIIYSRNNEYLFINNFFFY